MVDTLFRFAKFQYECGNYSGAAEYLYFVRVLVSTVFIEFLEHFVVSHKSLKYLLCTMLVIGVLQPNEVSRPPISFFLFSTVQVPPGDKNAMYAMWGKLASEILMQSWDTALDDLNRLKEVIDAQVSYDFLFCFFLL